MLAILTIVYWIGAFAGFVAAWIAGMTAYTDHSFRPLTIVALAAIWLFGGYRLLGFLRAQCAARLQEMVKAIAPDRFAAKVQIADEAGGRYVGIDPSAQTVVVIDQANGIQKAMPLSDVTEWEALEDPRKNYQRVTVRFRDYGYPSISIPVLTRNMERIKAQLRVAIG